MVMVLCKICSKEFYVKPSHQKLGWGKYCSAKCRTESQFKGIHVACFTCNKEIYRSLSKLGHSKSKKYFCSKKCQTLWRNSIFVEERSVNWINGIHAYRKMLARRNLIKECFGCKLNDSRVLIIHHVDHDRKNNDMSNLICLCLNCHFIVHHDKELDLSLRNKNN